MPPSPHRPVATPDLDLSGETDADPSLLGTRAAHLDIDLRATGKQQGHLYLPASSPGRAPGQLKIPVCTFQGSLATKLAETQRVPTVTILSGIHGDEFDGPLALQQLTHTLSAHDIQGRVILLPCLNPQGLKVGQRQSVSDALDLDLCFPGSNLGTETQRLAYEVVQRFIRCSDWVIDIRSGGRSLAFSACAAIRFNQDRQRQSKAEEAMFAFGAPDSVRFPSSGNFSCLQGTVEAMGKNYLQIIVGGGAGSSVNSLNIVRKGCLNVLRHCGVLDDEIELCATRLLEVRNSSCYVYAPCNGIFEPCRHLGREIWNGDTLARIVSTDNPGAQTTVQAPRDSILLACHHGGPVSNGDLIAIVADEVQG